MCQAVLLEHPRIRHLPRRPEWSKSSSAMGTASELTELIPSHSWQVTIPSYVVDVHKEHKYRSPPLSSTHPFLPRSAIPPAQLFTHPQPPHRGQPSLSIRLSATSASLGWIKRCVSIRDTCGYRAIAACQIRRAHTYALTAPAATNHH